jgi:hypothetical protein
MRRALPIALGSVALAALAIRVVSIAEPLGIDQSLWASAVRGMSRGQLLYRDVWEQRPPGIYFTYLAAFRVLGWTPAAIAWLDLFASAVTTAALFAVGRALATRTVGALAAATFAALTMPAWLFGHGGFLERSICETFIVASIALAAWCATGFRTRASLAAAAGVGLFAGAAIVYKPNAGLYLPALLLWMTLYRRPDPRPVARAMLPAFVVAAVACVLLPLLTLLWLWRLDLLADARVAVIDFNRFYIGEGFAPMQYAYDFSRAIYLRMKTDPLWLAGAVGAIVAIWDLARRRRLDPVAGLAVLWGAASAGVMIVNGARLFNSYFVNAFAPLALLVAWLLAGSGSRSRVRQAIAAATAVAMVVVMFQRGYTTRITAWALADFNKLRGHESETAYLDRFGGYANNRGFSARANVELADYVRARTTPDDRVFLFGISGAGVYFGANRLTAHRLLRVNFFVPATFPNPAFELGAVVNDLAARRPRYLIFEELHAQSEMGRQADALPNDPRIQRLLESYHLEARVEDFTLYRLNDGAGRDGR